MQGHEDPSMPLTQHTRTRTYAVHTTHIRYLTRTHIPSVPLPRYTTHTMQHTRTHTVSRKHTCTHTHTQPHSPLWCSTALSSVSLT